MAASDEVDIQYYHALYKCKSEDCMKKNYGEVHEYDTLNDNEHESKSCPECGTLNAPYDENKCPGSFSSDKKRFDAAYECENEECMKQNKGIPYEYSSCTYVKEYKRKCPKCGTLNESHSGGTCLAQ